MSEMAGIEQPTTAKAAGFATTYMPGSSAWPAPLIEPTSLTRQQQIRHDALKLAIADGLGFQQMYALADDYALYITTGEHPQ